MEKPTLGTDNCQGQSSGRRGVSSPALFPDSDYQPLPIVPLRCSDRLKDKDIAVPCAIPKPKKKNSVNSGSCSGLPGLNDRQNNRSTTTADMSRPTKPSTSLVTGSPLSICNGDLLQAWQQSSLPSQSSVSLSLSAASSRQRQGGGDIDSYSRPSPALPERLDQGTPAARGGFSIPLTLPGGNFYLPPAMCPLPLQTHTGFGQPMVAGPVFLPPCFPVPIQGPSLRGYRFHSSPLSPTNPSPFPCVAFQDVGGRLFATGQYRPSSIPVDSRRSSRTSLPDPGLPSIRPGGECRSPTPNKKSRLELPPQEEVLLPPNPVCGFSGQGSNQKKKNEAERIIPSADIWNYNVASDDKPGNVYNMRVRF